MGIAGCFDDLYGLLVILICFGTKACDDIRRDRTIRNDFPNSIYFIHLPVQSGSDRILEMMNRGYTFDWYMDKVNRIR
ncbi:MAG: tRNA (N6-isopentenyl adenosine(37)-C2)-methylthiotransferase MiaB, partial [Bacteroidota bacterium]